MKQCPKCEKMHVKTTKFCSRACANSRGPRSEEFKEIVRSKNKNSIPWNKGKIFVEKIETGCLSCGSLVKIKNNSKKIALCSQKCQNEYIRKTPECQLKYIGGYRKNSGRCYGGYFKGIYCHSTYELVWVIYNIDNNIPFERCREHFVYNKDKKYFPDFIDQYGKIIEIKGYHTQEVEDKTKSVVDAGRSISVLYKEDLKPYFEWFKLKYPNMKLRDMYDNGDATGARIPILHIESVVS